MRIKLIDLLLNLNFPLYVFRLLAPFPKHAIGNSCYDVSFWFDCTMFPISDLHVYFLYFFILKRTGQNEQEAHKCGSANVGSPLQELSEEMEDEERDLLGMVQSLHLLILKEEKCVFWDTANSLSSLFNVSYICSIFNQQPGKFFQF